ncbi:YibE/F family protein (plasmid) [Chloroflexota bacterium]|nr:YibE/F family protein [Chloroflexota bacterium]
MSRKTFMIILRIAAIIILAVVLVPKIVDYLNQPDEEETVIGYNSQTVPAVVSGIIEEGEVTLGEVTQPYQIVEVEIEEGEYAGLFYQIEYGTRQIRNEMILLDVGDKLMVTVSTMPTGDVSVQFTDFYRTDSLVLLLAIFILASVVISGWKGVRSVLGILLSLAVIILIILPGIQEGKDPLMISIFGAFFFMAFSLYLVYGWTVKTHAAVLGSLVALVITGFLAFIFVNHARLTGYGDENMFYISQLTNNNLNVRSLLLAGVLIGTLGVLDDLVISQASAVFELFRNNPELTFKKLFRSAMNIGQDHIAATVNTLVLAYAGAALPMLLLFSFSNVNFTMALNLEFIAEEIVRTMVGSLGLFAAVPITTALSAGIAVKYRNFGKFKTYLGPLNE